MGIYAQRISVVSDPMHKIPNKSDHSHSKLRDLLTKLVTSHAVSEPMASAASARQLQIMYSNNLVLKNCRGNPVKIKSSMILSIEDSSLEIFAMKSKGSEHVT